MSGPPRVGTSTAFLLAAVGSRVRARLEEGLAREGLSLRLVSALGHLAHDPGLSVSVLGRRAGVTAQAMHTTVRALEEAGAVQRSRPARQGQAAALVVTPAGRRLLARAAEVAAELDHELEVGLSPADREVLGGVLGRVAVRLITPAGPDASEG